MQVRRGKKGYDAVAKALTSLNGKVGKAGWFKSNKYADGTPVATVAVIQEYGSPARHIPPRPFLRPTIAARSREWAQYMERGAKDVLAGKQTAEAVMRGVADLAAGQVAETILSIQTPRLSPRTIAARLHKYKDKRTIGLLEKPLIDTGIMFDTVHGVVENK